MGFLVYRGSKQKEHKTRREKRNGSTVTYLGCAVVMLSLKISSSCKLLNVSQCFWSTFDAFTTYSATQHQQFVCSK